MTDVGLFVVSYLGAIGATTRWLPNGALAVEWPPTHRGRFGPSSTIAFDAKVAEVTRSELCVQGSEVLDRILADASSGGFHCVGSVIAEANPPPQEVLAANLEFTNARADVAASETGAVPYLLFNFRITLTTDEKVELLRSVLLDADTFEEHTAADRFLEESLTMPQEPVVVPAEPEAAYHAACNALETSIETLVATAKAKAEALLTDELTRIESFYEKSIEELYAGHAHSPLDAERVFRAEKERRIEEVRRKYALSANAHLVNVRTVLIPTTTMRVRIANARATRELNLKYDAVNLETNRIVCESCGKSLDALSLCDRGHLACRECGTRCAFCDCLACATCAPELLGVCEVCTRAICPDHEFVDEIGRKTYCEDDIHQCPICNRMVGPSYVRACELCGGSYCVACVGASGRCTTCRTLVGVPATHPDVGRLSSVKGTSRTRQRWFHGRNGKYTVLVGRGAVFQQLYVLDNTGNVVRRRKGRGLVT